MTGPPPTRVSRTEPLTLAPAERYRDTFAPTDPAPRPGAPLPAAWEGVYFPFTVPLTDLRPDGTPARDGLLPEVGLPRRMYAGEDTEFHSPLHYGDTVKQVSARGSVVEKEGARGPLVFVDIERTYGVGDAVAVRSRWHDVFLGTTDPDTPPKPPRRDLAAAPGADWVDELVLDARQLFRFSALTFNTHLVHYDRGWAREVEGLEDLLVHGPLTRILLMDAARRHTPGRTPSTLSMRSTAPMFVDRTLRLCGHTRGDETRVTAVDADDIVLATAVVRWR